MLDKMHLLLYNTFLKLALLRLRLLRPQVFTLSNNISQLPCAYFPQLC